MPRWIIRWGITLVMLIIGIILLMSSIIRYPDVIKSELKVSSFNSPKSVLSKTNGKLIKILVPENHHVKKNEVLGFMETIGDPVAILELQKVIDSFEINQNKYDELNIKLPLTLDLGELQGAYQIFYQEYKGYQATFRNGYLLNKRALLQRDLKTIKAQQDELITLKNIKKLEYKNLQKDYEAFTKLYEEGVISKGEYRQQQNRYLSGKSPEQQITLDLLTNDANRNQKEKELLDLEPMVS